MSRINRRLALLSTVVLTLTAAACSSSAKPTAVATTNPTPSSPAPYAKKGPHAVGYTDLELAGGRRVVAWYPAVPGTTSGHKRESIDVAGMLNPALQARVPAEYRINYDTDAYQDAPSAPAAGGYPLVVFSHGYAGFPEQSVTLATTLASWGFV